MAMVSTQDERLGVADHDVCPIKQTRMGIVGFVLMSIALHSRDITPVIITVNHTALDKRSLDKFFDRGPLDILRDPHFGIEGISPFTQRHSHKNFCLFRTAPPLIANNRSAKGSFPASTSAHWRKYLVQLN